MGISPPTKSPACKKYCLQSCLGLVECWQEKGSIPEEVGSSLTACIPTWRSAVVCRAAGLPCNHAQAKHPKSRPPMDDGRRECCGAGHGQGGLTVGCALVSPVFRWPGLQAFTHTPLTAASQQLMVPSIGNSSWSRGDGNSSPALNHYEILQ